MLRRLRKARHSPVDVASVTFNKRVPSRSGGATSGEGAQQRGCVREAHVDVFARLTRLRLAACHVELVRSHFKETQALTSELE